MKKASRAKKGTVRVCDRRGMIQLRWRESSGRERYLSLGWPNTPANLHAAKGRAAEIEADIRLDRYDATLEKYCPLPVQAVEPTLGVCRA